MQSLSHNPMNAPISGSMNDSIKKRKKRTSKTKPKLPLPILMRKAGLVVIFSLLIFAISFPVKYGIANVQYYAADHLLISWHKSPQTLNVKSWQQAFKSINKANELQPNHPLYLDIKGKVLLWGLNLSDSEIMPKPQLLNLALNSFKQSLKIRPVWANTWIDLAMTKWHLNQIDDEFWLALEKAEKFGPYMPEVNLGLSTIYMAFWPQLTTIQKIKGVEQISRTMIQPYNEDYSFNYRSALIERVKLYKKEDVFCTLIKINKKLKHFGRHSSIKKLCAG